MINKSIDYMLCWKRIRWCDECKVWFEVYEVDEVLPTS